MPAQPVTANRRNIGMRAEWLCSMAGYFPYEDQAIIVPSPGPVLPPKAGSFSFRQLRDNGSRNAACYTSRMAKKTTLNEIGEMLAYVVKHMATKTTSPAAAN